MKSKPAYPRAEPQAPSQSAVRRHSAIYLVDDQPADRSSDPVSISGIGAEASSLHSGRQIVLTKAQQATLGRRANPDCANSRQASCMLAWSLFGLLICFLFFPSRIARGQQYEVQGLLSFESERQPPEPMVFFTLTVNGNTWFVRTTKPEKRTSDYHEAWFDGTNLYHVCSIATAVQTMRSRGTNVGANTATAWVHRTRFLHDSFAHYIAPLCFAYASTSYLNALTNNMVEPIWEWPLSTGSYSALNPITVKSIITRHPVEPYLPTQAVFFDDGLVRHPAWPSVRATKRKPPYGDGFTNAVFSVGSFTNVGGYALPNTAVLEVFAPKDRIFSPTQLGTNASDLIAHSHYRITLTNATVQRTLPSTQPALPGLTSISDSRFVGRAGYVSYFSASNFPAEQNITNSAEFKELEMAFASEGARTPARFAWPVRVVLLLVLLCFAVVFYYNRQTPAKQTANCNQTNRLNNETKTPHT